jgi:hypothetical protein
MKANELRIGSWVYHPLTREDIKINQAILCDFANGFNYLEATPLTREWVLRANFNFAELGFPDLAVACSIDGDDVDFVIGNYYHKLNYVHELQNLYFALVGQELTFKKSNGRRMLP